MSSNGGSIRVRAIKWWNLQTIEERQKSIELFKRNNPRYADWDWQLIAMSTNMIERVYHDIVTCGSK